MNNIESIIIKLKKKKENNSKLVFELGKEHFINKNYTEAEKCLMKVVDIDEFKINSLDLLGELYKLTNEVDKSVECYKQILEIDDKLVDVYKKLVDIFFYNKKKI